MLITCKTLALILFLCLAGASVSTLAAQTGTSEESMQQVHEKLAMDLFNQSWDLLLKPDRDAHDEAVLVNTVHASLWHWRQVGQPINILRGEWMICHVYTLLGHKDEALYHAHNVLALAEELKPVDWDLAYCYEAMARVMALRGDQPEFERYYGLALDAGKEIKEEGDRKQFEADMSDAYWFGMLRPASKD